MKDLEQRIKSSSDFPSLPLDFTLGCDNIQSIHVTI